MVSSGFVWAVAGFAFCWTEVLALLGLRFLRFWLWLTGDAVLALVGLRF